MGHTEVNRSIYQQLYRYAERALRGETVGHSLQPTLLANDAYMQLLALNKTPESMEELSPGLGAVIIRRLLVDRARHKNCLKRGGKFGRSQEIPTSLEDQRLAIDYVELDDALRALGEQNPRVAQIVELKFFGGFTHDEIGKQLSISTRTVVNDWRFGKAWLYRQLETTSSESARKRA